MRPHLWLLAASFLSAAPAFAANRTYTITSFDRIRVDGPYRVMLRTGMAPFAKAEGSQSALDAVSIDVEGRTLIVRRKRTAQRSNAAPTGPVTISVGTHEITAAWLNGPGGLAIDSVRAQAFDLAVSGSGAVEIGRLSVDRLDLSVTGSASVSIAGSAQSATLAIRGPGVIDAAGLEAKAAKINANGTARVRLTATQTAKVDAKGLATVELGGKPACTLASANTADVSGCRLSD